jgi:hypothetical protein
VEIAPGSAPNLYVQFTTLDWLLISIIIEIRVKMYYLSAAVEKWAESGSRTVYLQHTISTKSSDFLLSFQDSTGSLMDILQELLQHLLGSLDAQNQTSFINATVFYKLDLDSINVRN